MKIALIFDQTRTDTIGNYFLRACKTLNLPHDHYPLQQLSAIPNGYTWYLRIDHGDDYIVEWPKQLRPASFYAIDTHLSHSWKKIQKTAAMYDSVFCCHRPAALVLPGAEWVPVACDPEIHGSAQRPERWDVGFIGTEGAIPRKFYLQALRERYPKSFIGPADYRQIGNLYAQSRIGFNYSINDDVNMRVFEVLAAGACLLTNALSHNDLDTLGLRDGEHLIVYRRGRRLFEQIDALLADPARRMRVGQAGRSKVLDAHTYVHRLKRMLALSASRFGWTHLTKE